MMAASSGELPRKLERAWDSISMIPIFGKPLIITNRLPRKRMVDQSMSLRTADGSLDYSMTMMNPPNRATNSTVKL